MFALQPALTPLIIGESEIPVTKALAVPIAIYTFKTAVGDHADQKLHASVLCRVFVTRFESITVSRRRLYLGLWH